MESVAIVTGASRGIGAAIARELAADGHNVVLAARDGQKLAELVRHIEEAGGKALAVPTDATVQADLDALVATVDREFGRLDILVNNAGALPEAALADQVSLEEWNRALALNLTAPWYLASRCKDLIVRGERGGTVINMTSSASFYPSVGFSAYNASKAGLTAVTRTLALEWGRHNIRVVGIAPGKIDTDMIRPILEYGERRNLRVNPLGRVGLPSEVAKLVAYLVSGAATFITGSVISIDGGEVAASGADLAR